MTWLVVDAMNVIGSRPDGWWHDRAGAVRDLAEGRRRPSSRPTAASVTGSTHWGQPSAAPDGFRDQLDRLSTRDRS